GAEGRRLRVPQHSTHRRHEPGERRHADPRGDAGFGTYHPQHLRSLLDRERGRNAGRAAPPDRVHRGATLPPPAEGHPARGEEGPLTIIRYTLTVHTLHFEERANGKCSNFRVSRPGIEPGTRCLKGSCSTD